MTGHKRAALPPYAGLIAVALGAVSSLAFAPLYVFPAFFVAFSGLVWLVDRAPSVRVAALWGWLFGLGHFVVGLYWVGNSFLAQSEIPAWGGPIATAALAAGLAIFAALAVAAAKALWREGPERVLVLALCWALGEWLRGNILTGFPWNPAASIWGFSVVMMQPAALIGSWALGLLTLLAAASPAALLSLSGLDRRYWHLPVTAVALFAGLAVFGFVRVPDAPADAYEDFTLRLVQANIPQKDKWRRDKLAGHMARYFELTGPLSDDGARRYTIWPETAVPLWLEEDRRLRREIGALAGADAALITGAPRAERTADGAGYWNSLYVLDAAGEVAARYDKSHLVPFGEYLPARGLLSWLGLRKVTQGTSNFSAGPGLQRISAAGLPPFSPLICFEVIFPGQVVPPGPRPDWLLNLTNDAWFGDSSGPRQHLIMSRFRAVEEGLPLVRVAGTGISAVIDGHGRIRESLPLNRQGVIDAQLPLPLSPTLYSRFGDTAFWLLILLLGTVLIVRKPA